MHNLQNSKKRLSQSPKNKSKAAIPKQPLQTITVFDKENLPNGFAPVPAEPVVTIPTDDTTNFTTDFSKFDAESRKKRRRESLGGRRVSFSNQIDVRHFYKSDDRSPVTTTIVAPPAVEMELPDPALQVPQTPSKDEDMDVSMSFSPVSEPVTQEIRQEDDTQSGLKTPNLSSIVGRLNLDDETQYHNITGIISKQLMQNTPHTPSLGKFALLEDDTTFIPRTKSFVDTSLDSSQIQESGNEEPAPAQEPADVDMEMTANYGSALQSQPQPSPSPARSRPQLYDDVTSEISLAQLIAQATSDDTTQFSVPFVRPSFSLSEDLENITQSIGLSKFTKLDEDTTYLPPMQQANQDDTGSFSTTENTDTIPSAVSDSAASTSNNITVEDFLAMCDVRFLDNMNVHRKNSFPVPNVPKSMRDILEFVAISLPDLDLSKFGCAQLNTFTQGITEAVKELESELNKNNPELFDALKSSPQLLSASKDRIKQLKEACKQETLSSWHEWRVKLASNLNERLVENVELLNSDLSRIQQYNESLKKLKHSIETDKHSFLDARNEAMIEADEETANITTEITLDTSESLAAKKELFSILSSLPNWKLKSLTANDISLQFDNKFTLHAIFETHEETGKKQFVSKSFGYMNGAKLDDAFTGLVEAANINSVVANLQTSADLKEVLAEISFRLGRVQNLMTEVKKLQQKFTVRWRKNSTTHLPAIEVEFSSSNKWEKFFLTFDVHYGYPSGELNWNIRVLFGEVDMEPLKKAIEDSDRCGRFNRLSNICHAVQALM